MRRVMPRLSHGTTPHPSEFVWNRVSAASGAAFVGSFVGTRLVKKVTLGALHRVIAVMLFLLAVVLAMGLI